MAIQESKNLCQHFASTYASPSCSYLTLSVCHPQLHSQSARESLVNVRNPFVPHSLQPLPSRLDQGVTVSLSNCCFSCLFFLSLRILSDQIKNKLYCKLPRGINFSASIKPLKPAWMLIFIDRCPSKFRMKIKFCAGHPSIKIELFFSFEFQLKKKFDVLKKLLILRI